MHIITSGLNPNEDHIEHYGVLGMKWGVHKAQKYYAKKERAKQHGNTRKANRYNAKYNEILKKHNAQHAANNLNENRYATAMLGYAQKQRMRGDITRSEYKQSADSYKKQIDRTTKEYWRSNGINATLENNPNIDFGKDYVTRLFKEGGYGDISKDDWVKNAK